MMILGFFCGLDLTLSDYKCITTWLTCSGFLKCLLILSAASFPPNVKARALSLAGVCSIVVP